VLTISRKCRLTCGNADPARWSTLADFGLERISCGIPAESVRMRPRGVVGSNSSTLPEGRPQPVQVALCLPPRVLLLLEQRFGLLENESERPALTPRGVPDR